MRWFKHLSMAHNDTEMSAVLEELGAEAYGVWWLILEDVASCMDKNSSAAIAIHSDVKWSQICYCSARKLRSIVSRLHEKGLIVATSTDNRLQIEVRNLLKYRDEYSKKSGVAPDSRTDTDTDGEQKQNTEETPSGLPDKNQPEPKPVSQRGSLPGTEGWEDLTVEAVKAGMVFDPDPAADLCQKTWRWLDMGDKLAAVKGIAPRIENGQYGQPRYTPTLRSYLEKKLWRETLRPRESDTPRLVPQQEPTKLRSKTLEQML